MHVRSWLKDAPIGLRSGSASCHDNDQAGDKFHVSKETKIEIKIRTKKIRAFIRFDRKMRKKYIVPSRTRIMIALAAASLMKLREKKATTGTPSDKGFDNAIKNGDIRRE